MLAAAGRGLGKRLDATIHLPFVIPFPLLVINKAPPPLLHLACVGTPGHITLFPYCTLKCYFIKSLRVVHLGFLY
jgi:hypothetical protein